MKTEKEYRGYTVKVEVMVDDHSGEPWKEQDGHGEVSEWKHRDYVNESDEDWILASDHHFVRVYDFAASLAIARRDKWGLGAEALSALERRLGRKASAEEILMEAVRRDFVYLREWCAGVWQWLGYVTHVFKDGEEVGGEWGSCWRFDSEKDMLEEAFSEAEAAIDLHIAAARKEAKEAKAMACRDIATV